MSWFKDHFSSNGLVHIKKHPYLTTLSVMVVAITAGYITYKIRVHHEGFPEPEAEIQQQLETGLQQAGFEKISSMQGTTGSTHIFYGLFTEVTARIQAATDQTEVMGGKALAAVKGVIENFERSE